MTQLAGACFVLLLTGSLLAWMAVWVRLRCGVEPVSARRLPSIPIPGFVSLASLLLFFLVPQAIALLWRLGTTVSVEMVKANTTAYVVVVASVLLFAATTGTLHRLIRNVFVAEDAQEEIAVGTTAMLASLLPVSLVLYVTALLGWRTPETKHAFLKLVETAAPETLAWIVLAVVVWAPLAEELVFRVVLQESLEGRLTAGWSITLPALLFASIHPWPDLLPLIPLALVMGYVYHQRHSYVAVVVLHALFNATNLAMALLMR